MRDDAGLPDLGRHPELPQSTGRVRIPGDTVPPPRVGVVLAAGRSERLREVTGGGSKALVRLGGLRLVERAVRTLVALGVDRVVVVVGYHSGPVAAVARRTGPGRVQVVEAPDWENGSGASLTSAEAAVAGEGSILMIAADHLFSEGALEEVIRAGEPAILVDPAPGPEVWPEATKVQLAADGRIVELGKELDSPVADCGAFLLPPEIFEAHRTAAGHGDFSLSGAVNVLASRRRIAAVPLRSGAWWQDIDTPDDLARAGRLLRDSLPRAGDGPVARLLNRRVSVPLSWMVARLRPNPDLLSALAFLVGVAGAILLGMGHGLAGGVLAQACSILDGVDGEVARLSLRAGPRGTLLDGILDRLGDAALCAGLGAWAARAGEDPTAVVILVAAATAGAMLSMATKDRVAALGLEPPSERRLGWLLGGRDGRLFLIAILSIVGLPLAALAATAATSFLAAGLRVAFARHPPP
jgi:CDP-L-myo-inositol myo-inositolphosphotransferase